MGLYDQDRDWTYGIRLQGDIPTAKSWQKTSLKIVEQMKGILDLGHNEGMARKASYQLDDDTSLDVTISPGVTNEMAQLTITSTPPVRGEEKQRLELPPFTQCPRLPLSRAGRRMFTQLFDMFITLNINPGEFAVTPVGLVNTPYIAPTLEQGDYCGAGATSFHGEVSLEEPFTYLGTDYSKLFIHSGWIGFVAPQLQMNFPQSVPARDAPCTIDAPGSPVSTPDIDVLGPGLNVAIQMLANPSGCQSFFEGGAHLIEGEVLFGLNELVAGNAEALSSRRTIAKTLDVSDEGIQSEAGTSGVGESRKFAVINFEGTAPSIPNTLEAEIVLLYPSELCNGAIGMFYGGLDGLTPTSFGNFIPGLLDKNPPCGGGQYLSAQMCEFISNCPGQGSPSCETPRCGIPRSSGGYLIGADRAGHAWIEGNQTSAAIDQGATANLSSRAFWFELDKQGFPNGLGLHNGPQFEGGEITSFQNADDLGFRVAA